MRILAVCTLEAEEEQPRSHGSAAPAMISTSPTEARERLDRDCSAMGTSYGSPLGPLATLLRGGAQGAVAAGTLLHLSWPRRRRRPHQPHRPAHAAQRRPAQPFPLQQRPSAP